MSRSSAPVRARTGPHTRIDACRVCGGRSLEDVLDLGPLPHADGFLTADDLGEPEVLYPTTIAACPDCTLLQLREDVDPATLFGDDYAYRSSVSATLVDAARAMLASRATQLQFGPGDTVVEIASNDGYFLRHALDRGLDVLGIEPVPTLAAEARHHGVPSIEAFFGSELAEQLVSQGVRPRLVVANNVLAHVPDLDGFVAGIATLLGADAIASIEVPYVLDLLDGLAFDTMYHQHRCHFSVTSLVELFSRHGLHVTSVERITLQGGSLRLTVSGQLPSDGSTERLLALERACRLSELLQYRELADRVARVVDQLRESVTQLRRAAGPVAAYGAAAKGTTLLNVAGLGQDTVAFVVDRNTAKHGRYVPGTRQPIVPVDQLTCDRAAHALILPWNLAEEIIGQQRSYTRSGGRFLVPLPEPRLLGG